MTKFFSVLDKFPIVRTLQVAAIALFIVAIIQAGINMEQFLSEIPKEYDYKLDLRIDAASVIKIMQEELYYILYEPLVLLGLAEIIKLMKDKKNDQN